MEQKRNMRQTKLGGKAPVSRKITKRGSKFAKKYLILYGLKIGARDAVTSAVETAVCRFCTTFGR
ncbi:hypothetical protein PF005_g1051 [Phytophthora fragariae]|uniref:Uncharacterized protein n=2 Tax=Phytophthora TaxID=4783 RepID=A0A6A3V6J9_9STRA|nr:hypothetical protein PF003_g13402 [Phytophthora fragariae]KAE9047965.1 hypothetical protein PR002_g728 [Phytophthora rubi]KAE8949353.1 hypothetical protein PF009_g1106 [Phytophthora fragariae]KAE9030379.1 hypothetical protein PF011_g634 [Phytophthora fragariae]KAE9052353.1 hypothetical protein PR001_g598 [Phytophthora rubi]